MTSAIPKPLAQPDRDHPAVLTQADIRQLGDILHQLGETMFCLARRCQCKSPLAMVVCGCGHGGGFCTFLPSIRRYLQGVVRWTHDSSTELHDDGHRVPPRPWLLALAAKSSKLSFFRSAGADDDRIGSAVRYALIPAFLLWLGLSSAHAVQFSSGAPVTYTIASSAASPQGSGEFGQTQTNPATLNLTAGDTLLVFVNECGDGTCFTTYGPQPFSITDDSSAIGTCIPIIGNAVSYYNSLIAEECSITQSATNANVTANFSRDVYWSQIIAVDVNRSPAATLIDEGVGTSFNFLGEVNVSLGPTTPTASVNFVIAGLNGGSFGVNVSPGDGFTTIQNPIEPNGYQGFLVEYMITYNNSPVTATGSFSSSDDSRMVAAVLN